MPTILSLACYTGLLSALKMQCLSSSLCRGLLPRSFSLQLAHTSTLCAPFPNAHTHTHTHTPPEHLTQAALFILKSLFIPRLPGTGWFLTPTGPPCNLTLSLAAFSDVVMLLPVLFFKPGRRFLQLNVCMVSPSNTSFSVSTRPRCYPVQTSLPAVSVFDDCVSRWDAGSE